jgi:RNA polymerase sigma-70 factor (ECF subfamily)
VLHLLALMLLTESRRAARTGRDGGLADQDRTLWDSALIAEGKAIVRRCLRRNRPGAYQIQAAINAVHADAADAAAPADTRSWRCTTSSWCSRRRRWWR